MNEFCFSLDESPFDRMLSQVAPGGAVSALAFLAVTEEESEEALQDALMELEIRHITLDISNLPVPAATGEAALRLRTEAQLVKEGNLPGGLEENDPLRLYLEEIAALPMDSDIQKMAMAYARGQDTVIAKLTNRMLPQVVEMAYDHVGRGVLLMDLIQEGSLGLWQAILGYQSGDFVEHARWWIRQYLARAVLLQARESGFGQRMKQAMEDYCAVDERLLGELGRNPTTEELAESLHMTVQEAETVGKMLANARLMRQVKQEAAPAEEEDPEDTQHVEDTALFQSRQHIEELLSALTEQEAKLLRLRFGLEGGLPLSPEETGRKLGLTVSEVVEMEAAAMIKLRSGQ